MAIAADKAILPVELTSVYFLPMAKKYGKIRKYAELFAARLATGTLSLFPLQRSMKIGSSIGRLLGRRLKNLNRVAHRNLEIAMPQNSPERNADIVRGTFESLGRHLAFFSHFKHLGREDVRSLVEVVNKQNFYDSRGDGRGMIFITGHFGSWEVFNLLPPAFGEQINILVRRIDNRLVEEFVDKIRTRFGSVTLGKREAPRRIFKHLKAGEIVGILADLNAQLHDGVFVDFFGTPACTTKSIAKFALKTNAVILPAFAVWEKAKNKYVVYLEKPVEYENTGDTDRDIRRITADVTKVVEKYVRKYPEQWLWIHKRWNTRPPGEESLYRNV